MRAETKVIDADEGTVSAIVSTETPDRGGDIIRQRFWDLKPFLKHPIMLNGHDYFDIRSQIGKWLSMKVNKADGTLEGVAQYHIGHGNEAADWGFFLASEGMAAFSVGFQPDMSKAIQIEDEDDEQKWFPSYEFKGQELLEVSHVTVPANAEALQDAKTAGLHPILDGIADDVIAHLDGHLVSMRATMKHFLPGWTPPTKTKLSPIQEAISRW